jgi:hypothetical protein
MDREEAFHKKIEEIGKYYPSYASKLINLDMDKEEENETSFSE